MRDPVHGDAISAARVLYGVSARDRQQVFAQMIRDAQIAHAHYRSRHSVHPLLGDGSLVSIALRRGAAKEPVLTDVDYLRCLAQVYAGLADRYD